MHRPHKAEKSFIQAVLINKNFLNNRKLKVKIRYTANLISINALYYEQNSPLPGRNFRFGLSFKQT